MSMHDRDPRSSGRVISDLFGNVTNLVRGEMDLARTEIDENLRRAAVAIGLLVAAIVVVLVALNVLAGAVVAALAAAGIHPVISALIVGGVLVIIGAIMVKVGVNRLKLTSLAPTRTFQSIERDAAAVKEATHA